MISIIMPVYGVEKYISRALDSIVSQTCEDWELLCIDDGSPDRSGEICDEYAKKDPRIKVIHQKNSGAAAARNAAMAEASGKYFYFMDSDDWAEPRMLEDMRRAAEENGAQLVIAGFYIDTYYSETEKFQQEQFVSGRVFADRKAFREEAYELFDKNLLYTPWNKLYDAEYIRGKGLLFPDTFWDDFPFNLSVIKDVERVCVIPGCYYHFIRQRGESETARYRSDMYEKREEEAGWLEELYRYWGVDSESVREFLSRRYIERAVGCIENLCNDGCSLGRKEKRDGIRKIIRSERAAEALRRAEPNSGYMKLMLLPFRLRSVGLAYLEGRLISFVKTKNMRLFAKLKANR